MSMAIENVTLLAIENVTLCGVARGGRTQVTLAHAPCGGPLGVDPSYPYPDESIGAWSYDSRPGTPVPPDTPELMGYRGSLVTEPHPPRRPWVRARKCDRSGCATRSLREPRRSSSPRRR